MPDGSLPNAKVRAAVLRLLLQLNFFFEDRKARLPSAPQFLSASLLREAPRLQIQLRLMG